MIQNADELGTTNARTAALACLATGIEAASLTRVIKNSVRLEDDSLLITGDRYNLQEYRRVVVIGGGKAADRMATALESVLEDRIDAGAIVTIDPSDGVSVDRLGGDHPVPSDRGMVSTKRLLELAETADEETLVIVLVTGGGSALMTAPLAGIPHADLVSVTQDLIASGAPIDEINAVRKHLSRIKGGRLAKLTAPATVVGLLLSDVVGNDPAVIASGPTAPDTSTFADAIEILERYDITLPTSIDRLLWRGCEGSIPETPAPDDPIFDRVHNYVLADGSTAINAARQVAADRGYRPLLLASGVRGEAREAAKTHVAIAEECLASGNPIEPPAVLLSGGETTVTVRGEGRGGPNQEFALAAALAQDGPITIAAVDTDGHDGSTDAAGGLVDERTIDDREAAVTALTENDAYSYLDSRTSLILTGRTGTNVNDLRVLVIDSP